VLTPITSTSIVSVGRQMNGYFASTWYDARAAMMRRLAETVIIEAFEAHKPDSKIRNAPRDFMQLTERINAAVSETGWNLSRTGIIKRIPIAEGMAVRGLRSGLPLLAGPSRMEQMWLESSVCVAYKE
jgi:hypothetical protein